jgi:hypothetical protein
MTHPQETPPIVPPDDGVRQLTLANPDDPGLRHIALVGDTYTGPHLRRGHRRSLRPHRHGSVSTLGGRFSQFRDAEGKG